MRKRTLTGGVALGRRIGVHDRRQFELKVEYNPREADRHSRYVVEAFLCVPGSLNVEPATAPPAALYADIHNYVRLKTPRMSWSELVALPNSPLVIAAEEAPRLASGGDPGRFIYECKLYACIVRGAMREFARRLEAALVDVKDGLGRAETLVEDALAGLGSARAPFRRLAEVVEKESVPERARYAFRLADESASLSTEQMLRRVLIALPGHVGPIRALRDRLLDVVVADEKYRKARGYPSILDPKGDNEDYVHRTGLLKKYCSSVLFLEIRRSAAKRHWVDLAAAIAAGLAMAVATIIAFLAQSRFAAVTIQSAVVIVVVYMLRERIKEGSRRKLERWLDRHLYDRKIDIEYPAGGQLGICREKIDYVQSASLPEDVRELRRISADPATYMVESELKESVIRYRKEIRLQTGTLLGRRGGAGVTDIMRFNIDRFLRGMDEPTQEFDWFDRETHDVTHIRASKVYHLDVAFRFFPPSGTPTTSMVRLILDRRGIKRIERYGDPG